MKKIVRLMVVPMIIASCTSEIQTNAPIVVKKNLVEGQESQSEIIKNSEIKNFNLLIGSWESNLQPGTFKFNADSTFEEVIYYNTADDLGETENSVKGRFYIKKDNIYKIYITEDTICQRIDWVFDNVVNFSDTSSVYNKEIAWEQGYTKK
jgi:hypothetical protein